MVGGAANGPSVLRLERLAKAFPGVQALCGASLELRAGEIHGLVGENGAGKSTLIKLLAGVHAWDSGSLSIDGRRQTALTPRTAHTLGLRFIHQELHLVPHFSVAESVYMGQEIKSAWRGIDRRAMREKTRYFMREVLAIDLDPDALVRDLGIAQRKLVQIARALIDGAARVVVFDEPTAPLPSGEAEHVLAAIRRLRGQGVAILYVSHYLDEITALCDRVTVLRNGRDVARFDHLGVASADAIVAQMIGRAAGQLFPTRRRRAGAPLLQVDALGDGAKFTGVSLEVASGEIVGIAGLLGSGREELTDTLFGLRRAAQGTLRLGGRTLRLRSPADAVAEGIALVPRDRRNDGVVLAMSVADNVNLSTLDASACFGLENTALAAQRAAALAEQLDIRPRDVRTSARLLSGGNQQKLVFGRALAARPRLFLLDEPTLGVDVGARAELYALIESVAQGGAGVVVSSSDPGELLGLCDRIAVLFRGRLLGHYPAATLSAERLLALTNGGAQEAGTGDVAGAP